MWHPFPFQWILILVKAAWIIHEACIFWQVGDYILSPEMCVERKSLSDLRQSFLSGRLYHQAEAMTKHYKTPILLIEFDRDKAFALHSSSDLGSDINVRPALHLPRLLFEC